VTSHLDTERLAVLVHEVRSPVAALSAISETLADGSWKA
jgi:signal transduction histidine kinase